MSDKHQSGTHQRNKDVIAGLRAAMYDWTNDGVRAALRDAFAPDAPVHLAHPFEDLDGPDGLFGVALEPLAAAWPDIERRDSIVVAGTTDHGLDWVGCCGHYMGTFANSWLDIPPTGRPATMRFHEFFHLVDGQVVEMQALWDIPEVMMQANVWPMAPSLGRDWLVPGPASADGILAGPRDDQRAADVLAIVLAMLDDMGKHPAEPVEAMNLERYWHPKFSWYGPAGIGSSRGIDGFRRHHQIPFLNAMPDRGGGGYDTRPSNFFAEGDYVGETCWPGMFMTYTGDGWLGIAPTGKRITMRSLDFWRIEGDLIRENWVLVDLLHVWHQLGVDVLARMRELA